MHTSAGHADFEECHFDCRDSDRQGFSGWCSKQPQPESSAAPTASAGLEEFKVCKKCRGGCITMQQ